MTMDIFENAMIEPSGYPETLGDVQRVDLGAVVYVSLPVGEGERLLAISPFRGERLTRQRKVRMFRAAAQHSAIAETVAGADDATVSGWANFYVHKSKKGRFCRYLGCAETHRALENRVDYSLDSSVSDVSADNFHVFESE